MLAGVGETIEIQSYKHNGKLHRLWEASTILRKTSREIIGGNDQTIVKESNGIEWRTREPAIFYFHYEHWFNVIAMLRKNGIHYYCNIGSPCVVDQEALKYIDYDLDLKITPDCTICLLDEDEYEKHRKEMGYPPEVERKISEGLDELKHWIHAEEGPFSRAFVDYWYEQFLIYR